MRVLFYSIFFIVSFSLTGQSSDQDESNKKTNPKNQTKGGCSITMIDLSLHTTTQTSPLTNIRLDWSNRHYGSGFNTCPFIIYQTLERQVGANSYDTLRHKFMDTTFIDTSVLPGSTYNYRLTRTILSTLNTYISYSDTISLQVVGLQEAEEEIAISKIYPVPANDFLFFETDQDVFGEVYRVINISGQTVMRGIVNSNKIKLNLQALPKGLYFLSINEFVRKFVVSKQ